MFKGNLREDWAVNPDKVYDSVLQYLFHQRANCLADDIPLLTWKYNSVTCAATPWEDFNDAPNLHRWSITSFNGPLSRHVIYHFLDNDKGGEELYLLSFTDLANFLRGCAPHDVAHHMFHLTRLLVIARYLETNLQSLFDAHRADQRKLREAETEVATARAERDVAQAALRRNGQESNNLPGAVGGLLEARAALARAEASLAHEQQRGAQLQVVLDQAAFRPWYANTVDPDPDRTAEEDYQQRLLKAGDYHLQLEMQRNDLAERNKTLVKEIATITDTIKQLEWQLRQALHPSIVLVSRMETIVSRSEVSTHPDS